jgi:molybdopterin-binding protein
LATQRLCGEKFLAVLLGLCPTMVQETMALSARNQLPGTVEEVRLGDIMAHVVVRVGENLIESVITRTSADELALKKGDSVRIVVKSTEVMIQK